MNIMDLLIEDISIDGGTQARVSVDTGAIADYADAMTEGAELPPGMVFFDGAKHYLADGFHRYHANRQIGARRMRCEVRTGTLQDAKLYAYGANKGHGLRPTTADKRKAVVGMLADFADWSDRAIAKHVGVAHSFVAAVREPEAAQRQKAAKAASAVKQVESDSTGSIGPEVESDSTAAPAEQPAAKPTKAQATAAAPAPDERDQRIAALAEQVAELSQNLTDTVADNEAMGKVFDADEKLAKAMAENKQLRAEVSTLRERVNGLLNEKNEAVRLAKSWKRKAEKAGATA